MPFHANGNTHIDDIDGADTGADLPLLLSPGDGLDSTTSFFAKIALFDPIATSLRDDSSACAGPAASPSSPSRKLAMRLF